MGLWIADLFIVVGVYASFGQNAAGQTAIGLGVLTYIVAIVGRKGR